MSPPNNQPPPSPGDIDFGDDQDEITQIILYPGGDERIYFATERAVEFKALSNNLIIADGDPIPCVAIGLGRSPVGSAAVIVEFADGSKEVFLGIPHRMFQRQLSSLLLPKPGAGVVGGL